MAPTANATTLTTSPPAPIMRTPFNLLQSVYPRCEPSNNPCTDHPAAADNDAKSAARRGTPPHGRTSGFDACAHRQRIDLGAAAHNVGPAESLARANHRSLGIPPFRARACSAA